MEYSVTLSNHALEEMVLAASESFVLGNAKYEGSVEIHGYLWGNRRTSDEDIEHIEVEKFSVSSSAQGDEDWVAVDKRVARLKHSVLELWAPHCHFLGMFHTHPYESRDDVYKNKGWEFSEQDRDLFLSDEDIWELSSPGMPIALVMAVTKIESVFDTVADPSKGRLEFNVGNLRFWLSVGIGEVSRSQEKVFSRNNINFNPYGRHHNWAGSRLIGVD